MIEIIRKEAGLTSEKSQLKFSESQVEVREDPVKIKVVNLSKYDELMTS